LPGYTGIHRRRVNVTRRRHARSNRLMIGIVVLILAVIIALGLLYVARHGASIWMNA
jgi:hypothetical protein